MRWGGRGALQVGKKYLLENMGICRMTLDRKEEGDFGRGCACAWALRVTGTHLGGRPCVGVPARVSTCQRGLLTARDEVGTACGQSWLSKCWS